MVLASYAMAERTTFPAAALRPQPRSDVLHATLVAILAAGAGGTFFVAGASIALLFLACVVAPSVGLLVWQRRRTPGAGARIEIDARGLFVDGKLLVRR